MANPFFLRYKGPTYVRPQPSGVSEERTRGWFGWERVLFRRLVSLDDSGVRTKKKELKVKELISELQRFPPDADVEIYAGKCCDVQPIHQVYFHPGGAESPVVVLVDETQQPCAPGRCNCSGRPEFFGAASMPFDT